MLRKGCDASVHSLPPHFQKQGTRREVYRAYGSAQITQTALESQGQTVVIQRIVCVSDGFRGSVLFQKSALRHTLWAVDALILYQIDLF
jgi:hypothetical protein